MPGQKPGIIIYISAILTACSRYASISATADISHFSRVYACGKERPAPNMSYPIDSAIAFRRLTLAPDHVYEPKAKKRLPLIRRAWRAFINVSTGGNIPLLYVGEPTTIVSYLNTSRSAPETPSSPALLQARSWIAYGIPLASSSIARASAAAAVLPYLEP